MEPGERRSVVIFIGVIALTGATYAVSFGVMAVGLIRFAVDLHRLAQFFPALNALGLAAAFIGLLWLPNRYEVRGLAKTGAALALLAAASFVLVLVGMEVGWRIQATGFAAIVGALLLNAAWITAVLSMSGIASAAKSRHAQSVLSWALLVFVLAHMAGGMFAIMRRLPAGEVLRTVSFVLFTATFAMVAIAGVLALRVPQDVQPETFD
ncbi:MAG: hypothetical protein ACI9MR_001526 [Myxococcota bacterium]|jgi:hypothetical protein